MKKLKNFKMYLESLDSKIDGMEELLSLIDDNIDSGWKGDELQESTDCVILEDVTHTHDESEGFTTYNGWYERLLEMSKYNPELEHVVQLIDDNKDDLWEHGLESTFQCVILENIDLIQDGDSYINTYNGWYEELKNLG